MYVVNHKYLKKKLILTNYLDPYVFTDETGDETIEKASYKPLRTYSCSKVVETEPETDITFETLNAISNEQLWHYPMAVKKHRLNCGETENYFSTSQWLKKEKAFRFTMEQNSKLRKKQYEIERQNKQLTEQNCKMEGIIKQQKEQLNSSEEYINRLGTLIILNLLKSSCICLIFYVKYTQF